MFFLSIESQGEGDESDEGMFTINQATVNYISLKKHISIRFYFGIYRLSNQLINCMCLF